jgi:hypothetical protein
MWLTYSKRSALDAARLLEGIANLYTAVLKAVDGVSQETIPSKSLGTASRYLAKWAIEHRTSPLCYEVKHVSLLLETATQARNEVVHTGLGQDT